MDKLKLKNLLEVINDYDIFLFDIWGVIFEGKYTYEGVVENINKVIAQKNTFFVTNAPCSVLSLFKLLKSWGLNVMPEMIISSGELSIEMISKSKELFDIANPRVYLLGNKETDIIKSIKYPVVDDIKSANIMLLTLHRDDAGELDLNEFDELLCKAVEYKTINICANPDIGINQHGVYRYCAGYYAQKLIKFGGKVIYTGKPYKEIYYKILSKFDNFAKNRILMIGDTFYTDILGANKIGIDSAIVLTGNATQYHDQHDSLEEKLKYLRIAAVEQKVMPNFAIKLN